MILFGQILPLLLILQPFFYLKVFLFPQGPRNLPGRSLFPALLHHALLQLFEILISRMAGKPGNCRLRDFQPSGQLSDSHKKEFFGIAPDKFQNLPVRPGQLLLMV